MEAQKANMSRIRSIIDNDRILIIGLFVLLLAFNFNKAVHIDDAFHLQVANYLIDHPTEPLSGKVLWDNQEKEIHYFNQPVLFFYYLALIISIFGENIPLLHLATSLFLIPVLHYFNQISKLIKSKNRQLNLLIFGCSYPLIVNQNIMVDVPLLACLLACIYFLIKGLQSSNLKNYLISTAVLSIGIMIKYTILPILIIFPAILLYKKKYIEATCYIIPIAVLAIWSYWNYIEVGITHIGERSNAINDWSFILGFLSCLGSMSLFVPIYFFQKSSNLSNRVLGWIYLVFICFIPFIAICLFIKEQQISLDFSLVFIILGALFLAFSICIQFKEFLESKFKLSSENILLISGLSISLFVMAFAPFIASRHLILVLPLFILSLNLRLPKSLTISENLIVLFYFLINIWIGIADYQNAKYFEDKAKFIAQNVDSNIYSAGYWGWQWYTKKEGMINYHWGVHRIKKGEFMTFPLGSPRQFITPEIKLDTLEYFIDKPSLASMMTGKDYESLYRSDHKNTAWSIGYNPIDTIVLARVSEGLSIKDMEQRIVKNEKWVNYLKFQANSLNLSFDSLLNESAKEMYYSSEY